MLLASLPLATNEASAATAALQHPTLSGDSGNAGIDPSRGIAEHALRFVGVRYRWGGEDADTGFDCSGLVWRVFLEVAGVELPRRSRAISRVGDRVKRADLQPGDLVFFNTWRGPASHVGIYLGDDRFIHAPGRRRTVEVASLAGYWSRNYYGARRILPSS